MPKSKRNALCGICTALSAVILLLLNFLTVVSYGLVITACLLLLFCRTECGAVSAVFVYVATSVISFAVVSNKSDVMLYAAVFGIITLFKYPTDRIKNKALRISVKFALFALCEGVYIVLTVFVFGIDTVSRFIIIATAAVGLLLCLIYDIFLSQALFVYFKKYRRHIERFLK